MTAHELQNLSAELTEGVAQVAGVTEQALLRGIVAAAEAFDHMAPLPDLHIRQQRSWEPAARHYRDLTPEEREAQA